MRGDAPTCKNKIPARRDKQASQVQSGPPQVFPQLPESIEGNKDTQPQF